MMGAAVVPAPVPAGDKIRAKSVEGVLARILEFGEPVMFQANVLRRTHTLLFESAIVVLTDRRLLLLSQVFPSGYELKAQHKSAACSLINHKERFDGSRIVAIRTEEKKTLCLYFGRLWRAQAEWICQALPEANAAAQLAAPPGPQPDEVPGDH
jgi:hypothetical protein